jgi:hypothetical protein
VKGHIASLIRRLAKLVMDHAQRVLPASKREWAKAMQAEFQHVPGSLHSLNWVLGCVVVSYAERLRLMNRSRLQVSHWLFGIESLICFGPLTCLWLVAVLNLIRSGNEPQVFVGTLLATLAPLALVLALRFAAMRASPNRKLVAAIAAGFIALGILQVVGMFNQAANMNIFWFSIEWRLVVLFSILPALCCWHLTMLETNSSHAA